MANGDVARLASLPFDALLERIAASAPAPGGGSAAALAGALAAALAQMIVAVTSGRKGFEDAEELLSQQARETSELCSRLEAAADADAEAYNQVSAAYRLPRADDEQKRARAAAIQQALKKASDVPLATAECCLQAAEVALALLRTGNPNAASDAGVAVLLATAALEGAALNVATNLETIRDDAYVSDRRSAVHRLLERAAALRAEMRAELADRISALR